MFSLAVYYQYQDSPALLQVDPLNPIPGVSFVGLPAGAKTVFAQKGSFGLFQAKLTLAPVGSNIRVPVSVTYSNRTELIEKSTWRGQGGSHTTSAASLRSPIARCGETSSTTRPYRRVLTR